MGGGIAYILLGRRRTSDRPEHVSGDPFSGEFAKALTPDHSLSIGYFSITIDRHVRRVRIVA